MNKVLPAINIQYPFSALLLSGKKSIETRFYPLPKHFVDKPMWIIETPGIDGDFKARAVGIITFSEPYIYTSETHFSSEFKKHLVSNDSIWAWKKGKIKWAWPVKNVSSIRKPVEIKQRRGIIFTRELTF